MHRSRDRVRNRKVVTMMAGMTIPTVIIDDAAVPGWVPDAIRAVRRRPATAADAWPAEVPAAVLALRLVGSGLLVIHPQLEETAVGVAIDGDDDNGVVVVNLPGLRMSATGLAPGHHVFAVSVGLDDDADNVVQPVTVDVGPGAVVAIEVEPSPARRPDQPPVVSVRVVPSGCAQPAMQDALTKRVSKGDPAERVMNALAAKEASLDEDDSVPPGPLTGTWTGGEPHRLANWDVRVSGLVVIVIGAFGMWSNRDDVVSLIPFEIIAALGIVLLLLSLRKPTPVSVTINDQSITLTRGQEQTTTPLADIAWATSEIVNVGDTLTLTRRSDPARGSAPPIVIKLAGYDEAQRQDVRRTLRRHVAAAVETPAAST